MKTIWKYEIEPATVNTLEMPKGSTILTVQTQNDKVCLWAMVDPEAPIEKRYFSVYGTGHVMIADDLSYVGTFQLLDGSLVFHVFENK